MVNHEQHSTIFGAPCLPACIFDQPTFTWLVFFALVGELFQPITLPSCPTAHHPRRFERRYPGRTRSNALGYGEDDDEVNVTGRDRFSADDIDYRPQQPQQQRGRQRARRDGGDVDNGEYRAGGGGRDNPPAGYYRDEDEYEY